MFHSKYSSLRYISNGMYAETHAGLQISANNSCLILSKIKNDDILIKLLIITFNANLFCGCQDVTSGQRG